MATTAMRKTGLYWKPGYDWLLALGLTALAATGFVLFFGMRYEVNDDAIISNIAAGAYGPGSQYLVYVNILLGFLLKPFYAMFPSLNWFVVLLFCGGVWAFARLGVWLLRGAGLAAGACLFAALLLCAGSEFFVFFHYGRYAGLFLTVGLLLVAQELGAFSPGLFWGIGLALLGSMLRFQLFVAVGGLSAALLLWRFVKLNQAGKTRAAVAVAGLVLLAGGLKVLDVAVYQSSPGWGHYLRLNAVRTEISDFRLQFVVGRSVYEESFGYNAVDLEMMENWAYYDSEVFPAVQLEPFAKALPKQPPGQTIRYTAYTLLDMLQSTPAHLLLGLFLAGWLSLGRRKNWRVILPTLGVLLLELLYLIGRGRLPQRIDYVLTLAVLCFCAAAFWWPAPGAAVAEKPARGPAGRTAVFCLMILVLCYTPFFWQMNAGMRDYWASRPPRATEINALSADKEHLYLLDSYLVDAANGFDVWHPRPKGYFSNLVFVGSWLMGSPFQEAALQKYGLENPYRDAIGNEKVLLADYYYRELKEDYLRRHYCETATIQLAEEYGDFNLYVIYEL